MYYCRGDVQLNSKDYYTAGKLQGERNYAVIWGNEEKVETQRRTAEEKFFRVS